MKLVICPPAEEGALKNKNLVGGIVTTNRSRVVPHDELMAAARELAGRIAQNASHGVSDRQKVKEFGPQSE